MILGCWFFFIFSVFFLGWIWRKTWLSWSTRINPTKTRPTKIKPGPTKWKPEFGTDCLGFVRDSSVQTYPPHTYSTPEIHSSANPPPYLAITCEVSVVSGKSKELSGKIALAWSREYLVLPEDCSPNGKSNYPRDILWNKPAAQAAGQTLPRWSSTNRQNPPLQ
jgi:hypothetical protein